MLAGKRGRLGRCAGTRCAPRAFTLIELLVVIAVMVLLIGITVPAMSEARRISKRTVCGTNLHSIGQAVQAYLSAHNDRYPFVKGWPNDDTTSYPPIQDAFKKEVSGSREVFRCPADFVVDDPACTKPTYWESVGTSYEWETFFNGKRAGRDLVLMKTSGASLTYKPWAAPLVYDFKLFHGKRNQVGAMMTLYADFHVQPDRSKLGEP